MTTHEPSQEQCPKCGRHETTADLRYAGELKRKTFLKRVFTNPLVWTLVVLDFVGYVTQPDMITALRYAMALTFLALLIGAIISVYRGVYGAAAAGQYDRYTCHHCGHRWTSGESQTVAASRENRARSRPANRHGGSRRTSPETTTSQPQSAQGRQRIPATSESQFDWPGFLGIAVPVAVGLALLAALVIMAVISRGS